MLHFCTLKIKLITFFVGGKLYQNVTKGNIVYTIDQSEVITIRKIILTGLV